MTDTIIQFQPDSIIKKHDNSNQLNSYYSVLKAENKKINLVSRETINSHLPQLSAESIVPFDYSKILSIDNYLDIGSGGGFPAFPIILTQHIRKTTLVERIGKKASALKRMADKLEINNIIILNQTLEDCKFSQKFDLITLRLVKLNDKLFKIISNNLSENGICIYYFKPEFNIDNDKYSLLTYSYSTSPTTSNKYFSVISKKS